VTPSALLDDLRRRGVTANLTPSGQLKIDPASAIDAALLADLKAQRDGIIAELRRRDPTALVEEARSAALEFSVERDGLRVRHRTNAAPDETLIASLAEHKAAVIAELRQQDDVLAYGAERGLYEAEWRVAGCAAFTALERADECAEARYGACLSCGGSIELHGLPDAFKWRRVASLDDVEIAAVRYVLASAGAIAREARR